MMKKGFRIFLNSLLLIVGLSFIACNSDDTNSGDGTDSKENTDTDSKTEETVDFSVGATVNVDGLDYTVVSNTIAEETSNNERSAVADVTGAVLTTVKAIEKTKEYADKTFGNNVLLLRVAGKVAVKNGTVADFTEVKEKIVPKTIPAGYSELDFFEETSETTLHYFYSDTFLVLGKEDLTNRLGFIKEQWTSKYYSDFTDSDKNTVSFENALKTMNFVLIRNYVPNEFKSYDSNYMLLNSYVFDENQQLTEYYETCEESNYYSVNKTETPKPAFIVKDNYENASWMKKTFNLMAAYGSEDTSSGIKYSVKTKTSKGITTYTVIINVGSDKNVYKTSIPASSFDSSNTYKADNINLEDYREKITKNENAAHYDDEILPYTAEIRQNIPVEFVLNDDGTVDFGESVYEWGKRWRDVIIEQNPEQAAVYPYY